MKVNLGTLEVTDEDRKIIKKAIKPQGRGKASREEVRDWAFNAILEDLEEHKYRRSPQDLRELIEKVRPTPLEPLPTRKPRRRRR